MLNYLYEKQFSFHSLGVTMTNKILPSLILLSLAGALFFASTSAFGSPDVQGRNVVCGEYTCTFTPLSDAIAEATVEVVHNEVEIQHIPIINITIPHTEIEIIFVEDVK
jgi:hypothetical protein